MSRPENPPLLREIAPYRRIVVLGTTGAGKTTLSRSLSSRLRVPLVELDSFRHGPNWTPTPDEEFRNRVAAAVAGDQWIVDGNYGIARDLIWPKAEAVIWIDYPFPRIFAQLLGRTLRRSLSREKLWNGNVEDWKRSFFSRDSILLWAIQSHPEKKKKYPELFSRPEYAHLKVIRIHYPAQLQGLV